MDRNLDGIYFRIKRGEKYEDICFSDMTVEEQNHVLKNKNNEYLKSMCRYLAITLKDIGDRFDIVGGEENE